jgi:dodecin
VQHRSKAYYEAEPRALAGLLQKEGTMAKKTSESVYKIVEVIGTSPTSWEEAAKRAVQAASKTLRDLRIAEVVKQDMAIENGKVVAYRTRMLLSFKYQA